MHIINLVRSSGFEPPRGIPSASPSSWCVCQFRHDRTEVKTTFSCGRLSPQAGWFT